MITSKGMVLGGRPQPALTGPLSEITSIPHQSRHSQNQPYEFKGDLSYSFWHA